MSAQDLVSSKLYLCFTSGKGRTQLAFANAMNISDKTISKWEGGNVMCCTGESEISRCGRKLSQLTPQQEDCEHEILVKEIENDLYVTMKHEMNKEHYITFAVCLCMASTSGI